MSTFAPKTMSSPVQPLTPEQIAAKARKAAGEGYFRRLPVAADIAVDEVAGGPMDETISSRMSRWAQMSGLRGHIGRAACRVFNVVFGKDHGPSAQVGDLTRAQTEAKREQDSLNHLDGTSE